MNKSKLREAVEATKSNLMVAWRSEYHASMSGDTEEQELYKKESKKAEEKATQAIKQLIAEAVVGELEQVLHIGFKRFKAHYNNPESLEPDLTQAQYTVLVIKDRLEELRGELKGDTND